MESIDERKNELLRWLSAIKELQPYILSPMQNDASFRRYFRVVSDQNTYVAMDALPSLENCQSYVAITRSLRSLGLNTPEVIAADIDQGFLLITDFGDETYLKSLNEQNADSLYTRALDALTVLQACKEVPGRTIPFFTSEFMQQEWAWHKEWFSRRLLNLNIKNEKQLDDCYTYLIKTAVNQPQVFMHRDYHSANLMVLPNSVGILDFQDAFIGPVTYDLVSFLRDCYIDWPQERVANWVLVYWASLTKLGVLKVDEQEFLRWFDYMGLQRHLKALLTFARKKVRDHQPQYLKHIPRTLTYLQEVSNRYSELVVLQNYLQTVKPVFERMMPLCVQ